VGGAAGITILVGIAVLGESDGVVSRGALPVAALASTLVIATVLNRRVALLRIAPIVWLGHRSYAVYLFHWPLLVLLDVSPWVAVALTGILAEVSHRILEWPIRSRRIVNRRPVVAFAGATMVALVVAGGVFVSVPRPATDAEIATATAAALADVAVARRVSPTTTTVPPSTSLPSGVRDTTPAAVPPVVAPVDNRIPVPPGPTVMVLGDSTANAIEPALSGWVAVIGGESIDATEVGCSPMFTEGFNERWYTNLIPEPTACRMPVGEGTDLVIVFDNGVPLFDHFDRQADIWTDLTEPTFVDEMTARYEDMIGDAAEVGAVVVFTTPPTPWPAFGEWPGFHPGTEVQRRLNYITMVTDLAARYEHVYVIEFGAAVDGDLERYSRADGLHLDTDTGAVNAVVDLIAPAFRPAES
jgi:hypothetical protein